MFSARKTLSKKGENGMSDSWDNQIGGNHYKKYKIQPMEYSMQNGLDPLQHTVIKYITRFRDKHQPVEDLRKARHCIDMLIDLEVRIKEEDDTFEKKFARAHKGGDELYTDALARLTQKSS